MLHQILLLTHITGAVVGISSGFLSMLFRKGASLHRLAGNIFVGSMLAMSGTAAYLAKVYKPNRINLLVGLLMFYVVATGWWASKRRQRGVAPFDIVALTWVLLVAVIAFTYAMAYTPCAVLGTMAALFALSDIRMLARGGVAAVNRRRRHLWRMSFALLIATLSFFPGQAKLFPKALLKVPAMYIPHIALVVAIIYWMIRYRRALPVRRDAHLPAVLEDRARRAFGQPSRADVFSERHEQTVDLDPVFPRQLPLQSPHRRVG
jgi:uncharacterized membrane protein